MAINNPLVPGDPSCYDLKWIVDKLKEAIALYQPLHDEFEEVKTEFADLKTFVDDYFDNLDLTEEVSAIITQMRSDGYFYNLVDQIIAENPGLITTTTTNWLNNNVTPVGSAVVVDSSLTISGAAADAKTVGDRFDMDVEKLVLPAYVSGKYINNSGGESSMTGFCHSPLIPITAPYIYVRQTGSSFTATKMYNFYSDDIGFPASQLFLGSKNAPQNTLTQITPPENAKYFAISTQEQYYAGFEVWIPKINSANLFKIEKKDPKNVIGDIIRAGQAATIKFLGDSIVAGYGGTGYNPNGEAIYSTYKANDDGFCWVNEIRRYWGECFPFLTMKNWGISGFGTSEMCQNVSSLIVNGDDVIIACVGINDRAAGTDGAWGIPKSFEATYRNLAVINARAEKVGAKLILISPIPTGSQGDLNLERNAADIDHVFRAFAAEHSIQYISGFDLLKDYCRYVGVNIDTLFVDGLHPNDTGYAIIYRLFSDALGVSTPTDYN